jgi:hypothetical protein
MSDARTQELNFLAKLVIVVAIALVVAGSLWYGLTFKAIERFWRDLLERPEGPMRLRFMLQPTMAAIAALRDGLRPCTVFHDGIAQSTGAGWTTERGTECNRQDHRYRPWDGRDLPGLSAQKLSIRTRRSL